MTHLNNAPEPAAQLSCGMKETQTAKQRMDRLREALRAQRNPTDKPLLDRLGRCGVDWHGRYRCGSPACVRCRFINIRHQQRGTVEMLGHFTNQNLAWVTVVLGATTEVKGISTVIEKSRRDTKNRFVAARAKDDRWNDTYLRAWHEIDAVGVEHMPLLPPDRKGLVSALAPMAASGVTWLPTWHGILVRNHLSVEEITNELQCQWPLAHQVHVEGFDAKKTINANLDNLTSYSNKFHCSVSLMDHWKEPWPIHWQTQFFGWLHEGKRNPYEGLRMSINQANPTQEQEVCRVVEGVSPMPFIHSFSGDRMSYNNTGARA